jgi:hypothetical protein
MWRMPANGPDDIGELFAMAKLRLRVLTGLLALFLMPCMAPAWAQAELGAPVPPTVLTAPLPPETRLDQLTKDVGILIKKDVRIDELLETARTFTNWRDELQAANISFVSDSKRTISAQSKFTLRKIGVNYLTLYFDGFYITFHGLDPNKRTAGDLRKCCLQFFELFYTGDPYSSLPDDVAIDVLTTKITKAISSGKEREELLSFHYLEQRTKELPEIAHYYYAKALKDDGRKDAAKERATAYIKRFGPNGKYYRQTVELLAAII